MHTNNGHPGFDAFYKAVRERFYELDLYKESKEFIRNCVTCIRTKSRPPKNVYTFPDFEISEVIGLDILSLTFNNKKVNIMVEIDYASRYPLAEVIPKANSKETIKFLLKLFSINGLCRMIISDRGTKFSSVELKNFLKERKIDLNQTTVYNSPSNGRVESLNNRIKNVLSYFNTDKQIKNLEVALLETLTVLRARYNKAIQFSPTEFYNNRRMNLVIDNLNLGIEEEEGYEEIVETNLDEHDDGKSYRSAVLEFNRSEGYPKALDLVAYQLKKMLPLIDEGSIVYYYQPHNKPELKNKLLPKYKGPYYVYKTNNEHSYDIITCDGKDIRKHVSRRYLVVVPESCGFAFRREDCDRADPFVLMADVCSARLQTPP